MDRQYIREHGVIERYLKGALTADEEQAFEEAYLGDPDLLDEVQAAERLREGIKELGSTGRLEQLRAPARWRQWLASPQYAAAASVLLAVSLGFSAMLYREVTELRRDGVAQTFSSTRLVRLEARRGGDPIDIPAPPPGELTVLQFDTVTYDTYRFTLTRRTGDQSELIWRGANLVPQDDTLSISVMDRDLQPGNYEALLEGRMNDWPAGRFEEFTRMDLRVVPRN